MESTPLNDMRTPVQTMPQTPPPVEHHTGRKGVALVVVFVALLLVVALWFATSRKDAGMDDGQGNPIVVAPDGQIASGFPMYLILDQGAAVKESYTIDYSTRGESMPYARYMLGMSYDDAVFRYATLLINNQWTLLREPNVESGSTGFYAIKETEEVNITLLPLDASTTDVQISYLIKQ